MYRKHIAYSIAAFAMGIMANCGEDPGLYRNETITFTTPVSAKMGQKNIEEDELNLKDQDSSNFFPLRRYGALMPWAPVPLFDYYLEPIPVQIPVSPFYSLIDYVHPFYAPFIFDDWGYWDDDR